SPCDRRSMGSLSRRLGHGRALSHDARVGRAHPRDACLDRRDRESQAGAGMREAPHWLADLQARFGSVLRTPLDRSTGRLRASEESYPGAAVADVVDGRGLAVYNRQYWFRLLNALSTAYPITAALLGHWKFNDYAARFLSEHPPRSWDLDRAADGFHEWM